MELIQCLIWLLAGVGVFIVGMNFMGEALEKSAGSGMKKFLAKISNNRFSGIGIGAGVTAIIQSSSATSVMVIGLVNAGVMTLIQATPIIMGANIGTTITGVLVALKNDIFNMIMYLLAFAGVMMGFAKSEKAKLFGSLFSGLGLIFVGLEIMSSEQAFGNQLVKDMFTNIFATIDFPLLLILVGVVFTALIQSSSTATGVVITMVGAGVLDLDLALFIILGANIGTCATALLASMGAQANAKRVAFIHFMFNTIGAAIFTVIIWLFKEPIVALLTSAFPGDDAMSLQMRVSLFHVIFNVTTTFVLLLFVKQLVALSKLVIKDKKEESGRSLRFVDNRLVAMPSVALGQVKKEMDYMLSLVEENMTMSLNALENGTKENGALISENEAAINFTNSALTKFLISLSSVIEGSDEKIIGSYFHVLNDLERIGDHAEDFYEMGAELLDKELSFSETAKSDLRVMREKVYEMFKVSKDAFENLNRGSLDDLTELENEVDELKRELIARHYTRLAEGSCVIDHSPYFSSAIVGLERVADHLVNVGYSIVSPTGSQKDKVNA